MALLFYKPQNREYWKLTGLKFLLNNLENCLTSFPQTGFLQSVSKNHLCKLGLQLLPFRKLADFEFQVPNFSKSDLPKFKFSDFQTLADQITPSAI